MVRRGVLKALVKVAFSSTWLVLAHIHQLVQSPNKPVPHTILVRQNGAEENMKRSQECLDVALPPCVATYQPTMDEEAITAVREEIRKLRCNLSKSKRTG